MTSATRGLLTRIAGSAPAAMPAGGAAAGPGVGDSVVVLRSNYRFRGPLAELARGHSRRRRRPGRRGRCRRANQPLRWVEVDEADDCGRRGR